AADIARVIRDDPGLAARLLKIVNSAFFSFPRRVETVSQAVTVVGTAQVRDLALATSVITMFADVPSEVVDMESFWKHSVGAGVCARVFAGHRREGNVERFFLMGLLHDIGRLIMLMQLAEETGRALVRARDEGQPAHAVEREECGFDHGQVGGALLEQWNLPASLQEAVQYHHRPRLASRFPVETAAVHVADIVAHALELGCSGERRVPALAPEAWEALGIDVETVPVILDEIEAQYEAVSNLVDNALAA
ncbi:MAG: HDOD domain-containing protein, partial [Gemmatimonadetes bacterium]